VTTRGWLELLAALVAAVLERVRSLVTWAGSAAQRLGRIPANSVDRALSFLGLIRDISIQLELEFAAPLDRGRLFRAFRLLLDAEPVLGCRLVPHWRRPYWEPVEPSARRVLEVARSRSDYEAFKRRPLDLAHRPPIRACLLGSEAGDRLLLKIDHRATDAGGLLEVAAMVSRIYDRLADDRAYRPEPNREGSRSMWQVLRRLPLRAHLRILADFFRTTAAYLWRRRTLTLALPSGGADGPTCHVSRTIPAEQARRIAEFGRNRGATINDVMLAAFFRALARVGGHDGRAQLRAVTTVSHRRYLPGGLGEAITNLCGMEYPNLGTELGGDLDATVERVRAITRRRKAGYPGLSDYVGLAPLFAVGIPQALMMRVAGALIRQGTRAGGIPHSLSNVGRIDPAAVSFDGLAPVGARILPGSSRPPHLFTCLSGYAGKLFLAASVFEPQRELVERFFDRILAELEGAADPSDGGES